LFNIAVRRYAGDLALPRNPHRIECGYSIRRFPVACHGRRPRNPPAKYGHFIITSILKKSCKLRAERCGLLNFF
jgi:hypothetical protein